MTDQFVHPPGTTQPHQRCRAEQITLAGLLLLCVLANLGLFAWGIGRGIEIKDESFMLTCYRFPYLYAELTSSFHIIVDRLFGPFDFGVLQYRIAGLTFRLLATSVLAWGVWRWLSALSNDASETDETREAV